MQGFSGARYLAHDPQQVASYLGQLALGVEKVDARVQALLDKIAPHPDLLGGDVNLRIEVLLALLQAVELDPALVDPRQQDRALALSRLSLQVQDRLLVGDQPREVASRREIGVAVQHEGAQALGPQGETGLAGALPLQLGPGLGAAQAHQRLTRCDDLALFDQHLGDDAAFQMLDMMKRAGGHDLAVRDRGLGDLRDSGPDAADADRHAEDDQQLRQDPRRSRLLQYQGSREVARELGCPFPAEPFSQCLREVGFAEQCEIAVAAIGFLLIGHVSPYPHLG